MAKNHRKINHEMITLARDSRGISQPELAQKMGVNQGWLSRIEGGLRTIQPEQLDKLADILGYPIEFFTQKETVYGLGISTYFHRKKQKISSRTLKKIHASIFIRTIHIAKLLRGVDIEEMVKFVPFNIDDFDGDAGEVARLVRINWKMNYGPINNVVEVIENAGGIVIPFDFGTNEIDAIYHRTPETPPLFFVNRYSPSDRLRFTLCHELGHAIMHSNTFDPIMIEKQAYEFAAEFLMPKRDIYDFLKDLSLEKLMILKQYWKVSMAALLKRAGDIEAITPAKSQQLWKQMSKTGFRKSEPAELNLPYETPSTLKQIIDVYFDELDYNLSDFSKLITLKPKEAELIYAGMKSTVDRERKDAVKEAERILKEKRDS
jgi:Zn-dependent peptidase ImmA (M78 family)/transcriptional regulator with XRE-family HTH domain